MDILKKHAGKIRETVHKQQQAVYKTFSGSNAPQPSETIVTDEAELLRHQQISKLYTITKAGKHLQREIIKGTEGIIASGVKQIEIYNRLSEETKKYGNDNLTSDNGLGKASIHFSNAHSSMEKERENLHRTLTNQVSEPLKTMLNSPPLDDARNLSYRYDRLRQEAEVQAAEVSRRQQRENSSNADNNSKLEHAKQRMIEISNAMESLGRESVSAMAAVDRQQKHITFQRLVAMVEAEKHFHFRCAEILELLQAQMISERESDDGFEKNESFESMAPPPPYEEIKLNQNGFKSPMNKSLYFLAEVVHPFQGDADNELSLNVGDYLVVRQATSSGWSEGELRGKAGWFPSSHVEPRERVHVSKILSSMA